MKKMIPVIAVIVVIAILVLIFLHFKNKKPTLSDILNRWPDLQGQSWDYIITFANANYGNGGWIDNRSYGPNGEVYLSK